MTCNIKFWSSRHVYKHCNVKGKKRSGIIFNYSKSVSLFLTRKLLIVFTRPSHYGLFWARLPQCKSREYLFQHTKQAGGWLYGAESHPSSHQEFFNPKRNLFWSETEHALPSRFMVNKAWKCSTHLPHVPLSRNLINYRKNLQTHLRQNFTPCFSLYSLILSSTSTVSQLNSQVLLTDWNFTSIDHLFRG